MEYSHVHQFMYHLWQLLCYDSEFKYLLSKCFTENVWWPLIYNHELILISNTNIIPQSYFHLSLSAFVTPFWHLENCLPLASVYLLIFWSTEHTKSSVRIVKQTKQLINPPNLLSKILFMVLLSSVKIPCSKFTYASTFFFFLLLLLVV